MANPLYRNDKPGAFPNSWYAASTDIPPTRDDLRGSHKADVCIIGAGFTGLSAALHLAEKGLSVVVLDAHRAGWGASGRNGGQVCSGYDMGQLDLAKRVGADQARALWNLAEEAKDDLRKRCAIHVPEARYTTGLIHACNDPRDLAADRAEAAFLRDSYGYDQIEICNEAELRAYLDSPLYKGGLVDRGAGHVHPLRYVLAMARFAEDAGARIFEMSEVHRIDHGTPATVRTGKGHVVADHVIIGGNGYLPNLDRRVAARVMPLNSFIAATEPLGDKADEIIPSNMAVHDSLFVMHYFRLSEDKRLLLGGRPSYALGFPKDITTVMQDRIARLFPQLAGVKFDYAWGGTLGMTIPRLPLLLRIAPNVLSAGGYSGHGVALSAFAGKVMAEVIAGQAGRFDLLSKLKIPAYPGGSLLRAPILRLAMTWFATRDRLGI